MDSKQWSPLFSMNPSTLMVASLKWYLDWFQGLEGVHCILEKMIHYLFNLVLIGYPPHEIESYDPTSTLHSLRIHSGESIILEELPAEKIRTEGGWPLCEFLRV